MRLDIVFSASGATAVCAFVLLRRPADADLAQAAAELPALGAAVFALLLGSAGYIGSAIVNLISGRRELPFFRNHGLDAPRLLAIGYIPTSIVAAAVGIAARVLR